jgi:hypothetical protein
MALSTHQSCTGTDNGFWRNNTLQHKQVVKVMQE